MAINSAHATLPDGDDGADPGLLADLLAQLGYAEYVGHFNPLAPDPAAWRACRLAAPAALQELIALFLLNEPVAIDALPPALQALLPDLAALALIVEEPGARVSTGGLVLLPILGHWLFCHPPQANPGFYFNEDSMALLTRMAPGRGTCLDLCAGPGLHALHSARYADRVTAVEIDPACAQLARINARLNRVAGRMEVLEGDLYQPVAGRRFDTLTANPPLLPYPAGLRPPAIGHGGPDGMEIVWAILHGLPHALSERGLCQLVGMSLSDGRKPLATDQVAALAKTSGLDIRLTGLSHISLGPGSAYLGALLYTVCLVSGEPFARVEEAMMTLLGDAGASHVCPIFLSARHGAGQFELLELPSDYQHARWHAGARQ
ncbi:methyltransferase [Massilia sp. CCM 9210]|uniref:methyltransferase n=1 Tax=Massilia scottii TaxID=3057166 RepID=UPI002796DBFF|nr:methyltransferase [Massilia sp. CCM 9210]MDQ1817123.1 methyltransferase [Massilia sp. CCM 9210]